MKIEFDDHDLRRLATEGGYLGRWNPVIVRKYREVIRTMQGLVRRQSFFHWPGLKFESLEGKRARQRKKPKGLKEYSVRLNKQWRVVFTFTGPPDDETILIIEIEDYHR